MTWHSSDEDGVETLWRRDGDDWFGIRAIVGDNGTVTIGMRVPDEEDPLPEVTAITKTQARAWATSHVLPADWLARLGLA